MRAVLKGQEHLVDRPNPDPVRIAEHHDEGKLRLDLVPPQWTEVEAKVLQHGSKKYDEDNWLKGCDEQRFMASALRHISKDRQGEIIDPESNLDHLAHAIVNLHMILYWRNKGLAINTESKFK